jgi:hypothetical protein
VELSFYRGKQLRQLPLRLTETVAKQSASNRYAQKRLGEQLKRTQGNENQEKPLSKKMSKRRPETLTIES